MPFESGAIRQIWHEETLYFSVIDVIAVLTDSSNPRDYWYRLKKRELDQTGVELSTFCRQLKLRASDGKDRLTDCADRESLLRIIMSVPSAKAEPFRLWLAQIGNERLEELEDPELGIERIRAYYQAKGYANDWIETRIKSIGIRKELTDEWKKRGVKEGAEYALLTAEVARATLGMTPSEHRAFKGLDRENLRDHMTNLELIFTMLGEEMTRSVAVEDDAQGFEDNHEAAIKGGNAAGEARKRLEDVTGKKVVSAHNFLNQISTNPDIPPPLPEP